MSKITICLSYYNQTELLKEQILSWKSFPDYLKKIYTFFIIDDCSKKDAQEVLKDLDLRDLDLHIYRVTEDLYCNIAGVRNLGAKECKTEWMIILDMDTFIPSLMSEQLLQIINNPLPNTAYKFNRDIRNDPKMLAKNPSGFKPHPAICLIKKDDYWKIGGCEEDLVGHYGYTDPSFWYKSQGKINVQILNNIFLKHNSEGEADIIRDTSHNEKLVEEKKKHNNWSTDYIRFNWIKLY